jgi:hypothetical protein
MRALVIALGASLLIACGSSRTAPAAPPTSAVPPDTHVLSTEGAIHSAMSPAITSFGAATDGAHIYVLGGYRGTPHQYSREGQVRTLSRAPVSGGTWEEVASMAHGLQGLALVHVDGRICALGGNRIENAADEPTVMVSTSDAECFDLRSSGWSSLPSLPEGRSSHDAVVIGSTIYVAGGWRLTGDATTGAFHETLLALDLAARRPSWRSIPAPFERRALGAAALEDRLVVVGGIGTTGEVSRRVDVYDPASGAFSRGPDFPVDAFGISVTSVGDAIYGSAVEGGLYRWRHGEPTWTRVGSLAFPRFFHRLVASGESSIVALGGISGMHDFGRTRPVEVVSLPPEGARVGMITVAAAGEAKNRQGIFLHDDFVYLFGGNKSLEQHDFEPHHFTDEGIRFHLPSLTFARVEAYPARRQTMATLVLDEHGLALGGFGHDGTAAVSHVDGYTYDFENGRFRRAVSLEEGRTQFGLTRHDGAIYVFGGLNYDPARGEEAFDHVTTVLRASSPRGRFETLDVRLPGPRRAFAGAALDGRYYLVGGMKEGFQLVEDCLAFDFATETFEEIRCPAAPRLSGELLPMNGRLYLIGGSIQGKEGLRESRAVEVYDPASDAWRTIIGELPFSTRHARAFVYGERLLVISTHFEERRLLLALIDVTETKRAEE